MPSGLGKRPDALVGISGLAVSPVPGIFTIGIPNPTVTGGLVPAIVPSAVAFTLGIPTPTLVRGHSTIIELLEGEEVRGSWTQVPTTSFATYTFAVTQAQLDSITNWNDLRVRVTATGDSGLTAVSWVELTVPAGGAAITVTMTSVPFALTVPTPTVTAGGTPPNAVIGSPASPTFTAIVGQTVTFDPVGTSDDGQWGGTWDFGDGSPTHTGTFNNYASHVVNHSYAAPGNYVVTWTARDAEGNTDVATTTANILFASSVPTGIVIDPNSWALTPGQTVQCQATVIDQFGNPMSGQVVGWASSNTSRATVNPSTGATTTVTAGSQLGVLTITATTPPGGAVNGTSSGLIQAAGGFNEPTGEGLTRIFEDNMSGTPTSNQSFESVSILFGGRSITNYNANLTGLSDSTDPISPTGTWRYRYPSGQVGGSSPGPIIEWWQSGSAVMRSNDKSKFYFRIHLKMGDPSVDGGTTFENQSVGTKLFYWSSGQSTQTNTNFLLFDGNGATSILSSARILPYIKSWNDTTGEFTAAGELAPNVATVSATVGAWTTAEIYCAINSLPSSGPGTVKDGVFKMWVNNTLTHNYSTIEWRSGLHPYMFFRLHMNPVWGGSAGTKTRTDYWRFGHVYGSALD